MRLNLVAPIVFCFWCCSVFFVFSASIDSIPMCVLKTPNSILDRKTDYRQVVVGKKKRYSTCTSALWFHKKYLAVLNFLEQHLRIYSFDEEKKSLPAYKKLSLILGGIGRTRTFNCFSRWNIACYR